MADETDNAAGELEPREPVPSDLAALGRELNRRGAKYLICGGFAMNAAGYSRRTGDIDLLIDSSLENAARVFAALESLPDKAVLQLDAGDVARYTVVRVADEIVVDLMHSAAGLTFADACSEIAIHEVGGVAIPFASPGLLWRMKRHTHREKDQGDLAFLRELFAASGKEPPEDSAKSSA